jgi:hypothetical protein
METSERRRHRSEVIPEAVSLYLEALAARCNASALALANEDGLLVAGTRGDYDLEGLAGLGATRPMLSSAEDLLDEVSRGEDVYSHEVCIRGETFYLASIGARVPKVRDAVSALDRILSPVF